MCSPPLESHLTGQGRQQGFCPWDTTPLNMQFWNAITMERTSLRMLEFHDKYIQISLWQFGMHSCIHGLILCWLPWSMLQYISRVSWRWGGIYVRNRENVLLIHITSSFIKANIQWWVWWHKSYSFKCIHLTLSQVHQPAQWPDPSTLEKNHQQSNS